MTKSWRNRDYQKHVLDIFKNVRELIVFDVETTGLSAKTGHIIELAAFKFRIDDHNCIHETASMHQYIKPAYKLDPKITALTGITDEHLEYCPYEEECFDVIHRFFGNGSVVLCGHNVTFDVGFLKALYARNNGGNFASCKEIDTLEMARDIIAPSEVNDYKLATLAKYCGFDDGVQFHSAFDDAKATAKLFQALYIDYAFRDENEAENVMNDKHKPNVKSINYWAGYRGYPRIYVETSAGTLYFDIRTKTWRPKDLDLDTIDLAYVERVCWYVTKSKNSIEFSKFHDKVSVSEEDNSNAQSWLSEEVNSLANGAS